VEVHFLFPPLPPLLHSHAGKETAPRSGLQHSQDADFANGMATPSPSGERDEAAETEKRDRREERGVMGGVNDAKRHHSKNKSSKKTDGAGRRAGRASESLDRPGEEAKTETKRGGRVEDGGGEQRAEKEKQAQHWVNLKKKKTVEVW
jgi:hypothetical protein